MEGEYVQRIILLLSLVTNCALGAFLIYGSRDHGPSAPDAAMGSVSAGATRSEPPSHANTTTAPTHGTALEQRYSQLRSAGFDDYTAKRALLVTLHDPIGEQAPRKYWRISSVTQAEQRMTEYEAQYRSRRELLDAFGSTAQSDPAFESLFKPYQSELPFLSSEKQLALQEVRAAADAALLKHTSDPLAPFLLHSEEQTATELDAAIRRLLTVDESFEYDLRHAFLSQRLLATGFAFTEEEFRKVFRAVAGKGPVAARRVLSTAAIGTSEEAGPIAARVRQALGGDRYDEFMRAQDPDFRRLLSVFRSHQLQPSVLPTAYDIIRAANDSAKEVGAYGTIATPQERSQVTKTFAQRDESLRELLGEEAFAELAGSLDFGGGRSPFATVSVAR